jgi:hypothetical protein
LVTEITVIFSQNIQLTQETRPMQFSVIQQIAQNNRDLPIKPFSQEDANLQPLNTKSDIEGEF